MKISEDIKDLKVNFSGYDLAAGKDETVYIHQPLLREGEVEMILLSPFDQLDDGWEALRLPAAFDRKITLTGSDPWPSELKKGTKIQIAASVGGFSCVIKGVVTRRYVRKLVINGTLEAVE